MNFGATRCSIGVGEGVLALLGTAWHGWAQLILQPLTMLNPHCVAGEHGLFGAHESEDIRTIWKAFYLIKLSQ